MRRSVPALLAVLSLAPAAHAQADVRAAFVANNGNLEGSVTSYELGSDGTPVFVDRVVTGSRPNLNVDEPGCNPVAISVSPSGRFLLTSHASGQFDEQITIIEIAPDATLSVRAELDVPDAPLDCSWITDTLLVTTKTDLGGVNEVIVYSFDPETFALGETDRGTCGDFTSSVATHPNGRWVYAGDSFSNTIYAFDVSGSGVVTPIGTASTGSVFALGVRVTPDGRFLYAAGGISSGGDKVPAFAIDQGTGALTPVPGSPFTSPGDSPARLAASSDSRVLYVGHGSDATCHSLLIDPVTGALTPSGASFDVGTQGSLGAIAALPGLVLITDESTSFDAVQGLYSFSANTTTGAFTPITPTPIDSQGSAPESIAVWDGPQGCNEADLVPPLGVLDFSDVVAFLGAFGALAPEADLAPPLGVWDFSDVVAFLAAFGTGCP